MSTWVWWLPAKNKNCPVSVQAVPLAPFCGPFIFPLVPISHILNAPTDLKHRPFMNLHDLRGKVAPSSYIAPSASVVGDVQLRDHSCVWYGAVVRGDSRGAASCSTRFPGVFEEWGARNDSHEVVAVCACQAVRVNRHSVTLLLRIVLSRTDARNATEVILAIVRSKCKESMDHVE